MTGPRILSRHGAIVVAEKPAGIPTEPTDGFPTSLVAELARELGLSASSVHAASRLDVGVSGVVLLAGDGQARRALATAREANAIVRRYVGIAARAPEPSSGRWSAPIGRAKGNLRTVGGREARPSETTYETLAVLAVEVGLVRGRVRESSRPALLELAPVTGRTHQLRVHAAHFGAPLLGDRAYRGAGSVVLPTGRVLELDRVLLHAVSVEVRLPDGVRIAARSEPDAILDLWRSMGGLYAAMSS